MTRPEFERQLAEMRARIAELPADQRASLEPLVEETIERNNQISRSALEGHRAIERLELAWERLNDACARLGTIAAEARAALARAQSLPPQPGLN